MKAKVKPPPRRWVEGGVILAALSSLLLPATLGAEPSGIHAGAARAGFAAAPFPQGGMKGKTKKPPKRGRLPWRAVASFLLEEGCHSAEFITTIHWGHHLLLSIGWRLICLPPNNSGSMSQIKLDVNSPEFVLIIL